jgi:hypothetical protein
MFFIYLMFCCCFIVLFLQMLMSDFCSDPIQFTLQLAPKDKDIQAATVYYLSCEGTNPNYEYTYEADYSVRWVNYYIQNVVMDDCNNPTLAYAVNDLNEISDVHIANIEDYASCQPYYQIWTNFVDDGLCSDVFGGVYIVWIAQTVTAICLFACTVAGIRLLPMMEKIDQEKFSLLEDGSTSSRDDLMNSSSHHSIELSNVQGNSNTKQFNL